MATKIETVYSKISQELDVIKEKYDYDNNSCAFGHFYLTMNFDIDDQEAFESITDGFGDNGIDAVYIDRGGDTVLNFLQFKFPTTVENIKDGFSDEDIKIGRGVQEFLTQSALDSSTWNLALQEKHKEVTTIDSYSVKIWVVRYTNSSEKDQKVILDRLTDNIENLTLNNCSNEFIKAKQIADIYESSYEKKYPNIKLKLESGNDYQQYQTDDFTSITAVCFIKNLYDSITDVRNKIFDGNVRYYNPKTEVTNAIRKTLKEDPDNFILYNNGITIFTKNASYNSPNKTFTLENASIINGAQTVGSIIEVLDVEEDHSKFEKSPILIRILEVKSNDRLMNDIVLSLNTQTKMFSAYSISNDMRLKDLQKEINTQTKYFLEIKYNEFDDKKKKGEINKYKKDKLDTEKLIQCYVGYYDTNGKANLAKSAKSDLFKDDELINKIMDEINLEKFNEFYSMYLSIMDIITSFRSYRSSGKTNIFEKLNITDSEIDDYQFLNTGDIIILFAARHCKIAKSTFDKSEAINTAIKIIAQEIKKYPKKSRPALSNLTRSKELFDKVKNRIHKSLKNR